MISVLQILGLIVPVFIMFGVYFCAYVECQKPNREDDAVPTFALVLFGLAIFVLGFTLGTVVMGNS